MDSRLNLKENIDSQEDQHCVVHKCVYIHHVIAALCSFLLIFPFTPLCLDLAEVHI